MYPYSLVYSEQKDFTPIVTISVLTRSIIRLHPYVLLHYLFIIFNPLVCENEGTHFTKLSHKHIANASKLWRIKC